MGVLSRQETGQEGGRARSGLQAGREIAQDRLWPPLGSLLHVLVSKRDSRESGKSADETDCMREVEQQLSQEACARPWCTRRHSSFAPFTPCNRSKASERCSEWRERGESVGAPKQVPIALRRGQPSTTLHSLYCCVYGHEQTRYATPHPPETFRSQSARVLNF